MEGQVISKSQCGLCDEQTLENQKYLERGIKVIKNLLELKARKVSRIIPISNLHSWMIVDNFAVLKNTAMIRDKDWI